MNIVILGGVPSKKNSKRVFRTRQGKMLFVPSEAHSEWHRSASYQVASWKNKANVRHHLPLHRADVAIKFYPKSAHAWDLTNKAESIMDLLVDTGVLLDDNVLVVPNLILSHGDIDRTNPRAEITLTYG